MDNFSEGLFFELKGQCTKFFAHFVSTSIYVCKWQKRFITTYGCAAGWIGFSCLRYNNKRLDTDCKNNINIHLFAFVQSGF